MPQPKRVRLSTFDGTMESKAIEVPVEFVPVFSRLADGRWLVAEAWDEGEKNTRLYTPDGAPDGAFSMGEGILYIRCAPDATIWVGYFDEGVFAGPNDGGTWPISSSGIAQFSPDGNVLWEFNSEACPNLSIADCYALTLDGDTPWSCPYADFPIVRVERGRIRYWENVVTGASALAIDGDHVLLAGGYGDNANRIALLRLGANQAEPLGELHVPLLSRGAAGLVQGNGMTLHIVAEGRWTRLDVSRVRAILGV
jgi:hypothetical protein